MSPVAQQWARGGELALRGDVVERAEEQADAAVAELDAGAGSPAPAAAPSSVETVAKSRASIRAFTNTVGRCTWRSCS